MKECPFGITDCETCRFNFGPSICGVFSAACDASLLPDVLLELQEMKVMLKILLHKD